jgi:hypothetical protein
VKVLVGIDVVERQPGRPKSLELGRDLGRELLPHARTEEDIEPQAGHVGAEAPARPEKIGDLGAGQHWPSLDQ